MKLRDLTYAQARERHPNETALVVRRLRASRSREREVDPADLSWSYEISVTIRASGSLSDVLREKVRYERQSDEERVSDLISDTTTWLFARKRHWWATESVPNPPEVRERSEKVVRERREP